MTSVDLESGENESVTIKDNYVLVVDGACYLDTEQHYANGTAVLTIKRRSAVEYEASGEGEK